MGVFSCSSFVLFVVCCCLSFTCYMLFICVYDICVVYVVLCLFVLLFVVGGFAWFGGGCVCFAWRITVYLCVE